MKKIKIRETILSKYNRRKNMKKLSYKRMKTKVKENYNNKTRPWNMSWRDWGKHWSKDLTKNNKKKRPIMTKKTSEFPFRPNTIKTAMLSQMKSQTSNTKLRALRQESGSSKRPNKPSPFWMSRKKNSKKSMFKQNKKNMRNSLLHISMAC